MHFTSRSLSGGGEGLFFLPRPLALVPPPRHVRSSSSLMGVEGLCPASKSPKETLLTEPQSLHAYVTNEQVKWPWRVDRYTLQNAIH